MFKREMRKITIFISVVSLIYLAGCGRSFEPGSSIVGKWVCDSNPSTGWQIEYKADETYVVTFNGDKQAWRGKYKRNQFTISYQPDVPTEDSKNYLQGELVAIDRNKSHQLLFGVGSGDISRTCDLVNI